MSIKTLLLRYHADRFEIPKPRNSSHNQNKLRLHGGIITENIIQALARIIVTDQILAIHEKYPVAFSVHDEITAIASNANAKIALEDIVNIMRTPPTWAPSLPLDAEGAYGDHYAK